MATVDLSAFAEFVGGCAQSSNSFHPMLAANRETRCVKRPHISIQAAGSLAHPQNALPEANTAGVESQGSCLTYRYVNPPHPPSAQFFLRHASKR